MLYKSSSRSPEVWSIVSISGGLDKCRRHCIHVEPTLVQQSASERNQTQRTETVPDQAQPIHIDVGVCCFRGPPVLNQNVVLTRGKIGGVVPIEPCSLVQQFYELITL